MKKSGFFAALAAALLVLALTLPAVAQPPLWAPDPPHSRATFMIKHIFVPITGWFDGIEAKVRFDPKDLANSSVEMVIKVAGINTGIAARDKHLRSPEFFDVARYPEIRFVSKDIRHITGDQYAARGTLTIKDVTADTEMPFTYLGQTGNPMNKGQVVAGFEAQIIVDRLFFHVGDGKYLKMGVVGKDATVLLGMEMIRQDN